MLKEKIQIDLNAALKARDNLKTSTLRFVLSEIKNKEIEKRGSPLTDDDITRLLAASVKRRQESIVQFRAGGRQDLAEKEQAELVIIKSYLPESISREDLVKLVKQTIQKLSVGPGDFGKVIKEVLARAHGRAEGKVVSEIVKAELK